MSLITPPQKFRRAVGIPRTRRQRLDGPLTDEELTIFRSWLTQSGSLLSSNAVKTALVGDNAITGLWTEFGTTPTTGKFIDITIKRTFRTELIVWLGYGFDYYNAEHTTPGVTVDFGDELYRQITWVRGATSLGAFSGQTNPLFAFDISGGSTNSEGYHGGLVLNDEGLDDDEVEGDQNYEFTCKNDSGTNIEVFAYNLIMLERKR